MSTAAVGNLAKFNFGLGELRLVKFSPGMALLPWLGLQGDSYDSDVGSELVAFSRLVVVIYSD